MEGGEGMSRQGELIENVRPTELAAPTTVTPMMLIERASQQGASIEQMQQLFDLKLRVEADEARKAFNEAMAKFKHNPPRINKNVQKKAGNIDLHYASLDNVVDMVAPALSAVGIRHRWENKQYDGLISVTCILSHDLGHSESTTLAALPDGSGSKNSIQAIASTVTYLQRYTLLGATGLAAAGTDNDGEGGKKGPAMAVGVLADYLSNIESAIDEPELKAAFNPAYKKAQEIGDKSAQADLIKARDARKARL
jgi:hypothetical protein